MEKLRADLNRAPSWATHYVHGPHSDSWWFVNIHTKEWTVYNRYDKKFHRGYREGELEKGDGYFWLELNMSLENK